MQSLFAKEAFKGLTEYTSVCASVDCLGCVCMYECIHFNNIQLLNVHITFLST